MQPLKKGKVAIDVFGGEDSHRTKSISMYQIEKVCRRYVKIEKMASKTNVDRGGVERGACTNCHQCFEFYADTVTILCGYCKCATSQHKAEMQSDHAPETEAEMTDQVLIQNILKLLINQFLKQKKVSCY